MLYCIMSYHSTARINIMLLCVYLVLLIGRNQVVVMLGGVSLTH